MSETTTGGLTETLAAAVPDLPFAEPRDARCPSCDAQPSAILPAVATWLRKEAPREAVARALDDCALDTDGFAGPADLADAVTAALADLIAAEGGGMSAGEIRVWHDEARKARRAMAKEEFRCRCGSNRFVSASFDGGYTRVPQCIPCGRVHPGYYGHGSQSRKWDSTWTKRLAPAAADDAGRAK